MMCREVLIRVTADVLPEKEQRWAGVCEKNAKMQQAYDMPVFRVWLQGLDANGEPVSREWKALRFIPFCDQVAKVVPRTIVVGLSFFPEQPIKYYIEDELVECESGSIRIKDNFLILGGPQSFTSEGWGGTGFVEILGQPQAFRADILELAGIGFCSATDAMQQLIARRKLLVVLEMVPKPLLRDLAAD
jgi:hypothetical protein